ncbi:WD40 repeat protein [Chitinophaga skermanii]|uniref:WD40 repeat protein n=1 Tax=Chitinophaga skermanii TaxID=331697 RepID=A0A327QB75_9BACT|nr:OmpA family protein [Chitinophaga skermanii]RAJ01680.1 WD40 repeat protein [Chitinophaga skermanii]
MKKFTLLWICTLVGIVNSLQAQYVVDYKRTADVYFEAKDFYSAAQYYNKAMTKFDTKTGTFIPYVVEKSSKKEQKKNKDYEEVKYRLAESYRNYYDYASAEKWYASIIADNPAETTTLFPLVRYWDGVCLRALGRYEEALTQFQQFKASYKGYDDYSAKTLIEIATCEFAVEEMKKIPRYTVTKLAGSVNQGGANYAAALPDQTSMIFTSSRPDSGALDKKGNPYVNKLYFAKGGDANFNVQQKLDIPLEKGVDMGVSSITPDGNTMFLTKWTTKNGQKNSSIYMSTKSGSVWSEPKKLSANVNAEGYSSKAPSVTPDGKYLLFSSNRPGGMGKYDIWYCQLQNGTPNAPTNFGNIINSKDDEDAPFYDTKNEVLLWSTNGRIGFGGMDFFIAQGNFGNWQTPTNLGWPMNSPKDDIYFTSSNKDVSLQGGYFSSDRESVCCLELFKMKKLAKMMTGSVLDCDSQAPLTGAKITLIDPSGNKILKQITLNETGRYYFEVDPQRDYKIVAEKENYFSKVLTANTESLLASDTLFNPSLCLQRYEVGKPIILKDIYYDYDKATLRPQSLVVLDTLYNILVDNPEIEIELSAHTDSKGTDAYNFKLSDARAQSCVDYLVSKGISRSRIIAHGYGETKPIAPNTLPNGKDNPDGRQLNRRTEFKVLRTGPKTYGQ